MQLLERTDVVQQLLREVDKARRGSGGVVLLRGEAGIGKTSVATVLAGAASGDVRVLWGWCDDLLAPRALGPFWDMAVDDPALSAALHDDDPRRQHRGVLDALVHTRRPTVVVVEDVHWADGATLDLLTLVGRRVRGTHTLVVLTLREVAPDHPLTPVLASLPRDALLSITLQPLSRAAVRRLARTEDEADRVLARTGGNPFLVSALLSGDGDEVPAGVRDVVGALVARVDGAARDLVEVVSVCPGQADLALLHAVDPALPAARDDVEHLGLLRSAPTGLAFRHELARSAVEEGLSPGRRAELHRRVLAAAEGLCLDPSRLAHHARHAGDVEAVVRLLPVAARQAARDLSHREALIHLTALEPHLGRFPPAERAGLLELWSVEAEIAEGGGLDQALEAVTLRREAEDVAGAGAALVRASMAAWATGAFTRSGVLAGEAVTVLEGVGGEALALAYAQRARAALRAQEFGQALEDARTALGLAPAPGRARALALIAAGNARYALGDTGATALLEEAAAEALDLGLTWEAQRARGNLVEAFLSTKDVDRAQELNDRFRSEVDDDLAVAPWHELMTARIAVARGHYEEADGVLSRLLDRPDLIESLRYWCDALLAEVDVRRGHPRAREAVETFSQWADEDGEFQDRVWSATVSALHLWTFRRSDAAATARNLEVLGRVDDRGTAWGVGELALWLWLDGHLDALPERAAEPVRRLGNGDWRTTAGWFEQRGMPFEQAVALGRGDVPARLEALRVAQRIGARALAARFRSALEDDGVEGIPRGPRPRTRASALGLTRRQDEVLALLADGLANAEIAQRLFLSPRTVENHVSAILTTLGVTSRDEAVAVAREAGGHG